MKTMYWSIPSGVAITLLTGLVSNTATDWLGATFYGYPMRWLTKLVLAPEYFPWRIDSKGLVVDLVVWITVMGSALFSLSRFKR